MMTRTNPLALGAAATLAWAMAAGAQPIEKTGPCAASSIGRYPPPVYTANTGAPSHGSGVPSGSIGNVENWNSFPIKPTSQFIQNCGGGTSQVNCTLQNPMMPAFSVNCIEVPEGLKVQLWASEESPGNIRYVQDFTFDERGRLWGVEPIGYPNTNRSVAQGKFSGGLDRIVILEDTNGDKVMDSFKVFAHGLSMPQGLEIVPGGVVVQLSPYLVFFPNVGDTAGPHEILWQGMGSSNANWDTHGGINSLTYGLDNFLYSHIGYNGNACSPQLPGGGGGITCTGGNIFRFKHTAIGSDTTLMERVSNNGPSNASGIGQMEDGQWFKSGATGTPHSNHQVRFGQGAVSILSGTGNNVYYPITQDRWLWEGSTSQQTNGFNSTGSSAASGHHFYTSRLLPEKYWNRFAFVCEGASKLCNQDSMVVNGSTWSAVRMPGPARSNIFASEDAWVAPLWAKTGPDGAIWVLDWNNYLFLHNPASPSGGGSAWHNHLRAKTSNRIYRIVPQDGSTEPVLNLTNATMNQLIDALHNPNFLWRLHAQRQLLGKDWTSTERDTLLNKLENILLTNRNVDVVGINGPVLHSLWTLHGMKEFQANPARWDTVLKDLLLHPAWTVRRNVPLAMPATAASAEALKAQCAVNDEHAHVRVQALDALAGMPAPASGPATMVEGFRTTDTHSQAAFTGAGATRVVEVPGSERPATCPSYYEAVSIRTPTGQGFAAVRRDLSFELRGNGFELLPQGQLGSGELTVHDLRGQMVFRSSYNSAAGTWSQASARNMVQPVYFYSFRGVNGDTFNGRISMSTAY